MSWEERLFGVLDDLEQQAEAMYDAERAVELADRARTEYAEVSLASRLVASRDRAVRLTVRGVGAVAGDLRRLGEGWCLLAGHGGDWLVPLAAVLTVEGHSERSVPEAAWSPLSRLGLGSVLRRLADAGEPCGVHLVDGARHDLVVERVGRDFVECRDTAGRSVLVAFAALAAVRSRG